MHTKDSSVYSANNLTFMRLLILGTGKGQRANPAIVRSPKTLKRRVFRNAASQFILIVNELNLNARQKPFIKRRSFVAIYIPVTAETNCAISRDGLGSVRVARTVS